MRWTPRELWRGETIYIIGGGSSLATFPWDLLKGKKVLGCNSAFLLGVDVCRNIIFNDEQFFCKNKDALIKYFEQGGTIYSSCSSSEINEAQFVRQIPRYQDGVHKDGLGWNGNTGASAINLALILGATRIRLLGYDMHYGAGKKNNWHDNGGLQQGNPALYNKFAKAFLPFSKGCASVFPNCEIKNANDDSSLDCFEMMSMEDLVNELSSCDR